MYSATLSLTSALDGGGWSTPRPGRFTPGNDPVPIVQKVLNCKAFIYRMLSGGCDILKCVIFSAIESR